MRCACCVHALRLRFPNCLRCPGAVLPAVALHCKYPCCAACGCPARTWVTAALNRGLGSASCISLLTALTVRSYRLAACRLQS